jgi:hypothetical protein
MAQASIAAMPTIGASRARPAPRLARTLDALRKTFKTMFDPYRPELYYMRGPGPKWREKHGRTGAGL